MFKDEFEASLISSFLCLNMVVIMVVDLKQLQRKNQSGYEPLNLENGSFLNSDSFDTTNLRF